MLTKKTLALAPLALVLALAPTAAFAQAEPAPAPAPTPAPATGGGGNVLGGDIAIAIPFGNLGDGASIGFGPLVRFEHTLVPKLNLTARVGFIYHLPKTNAGIDITFTEVPVLVGVKYDLTDAIYGAAEIGFVRAGASAKVAGSTVSSSDTNAAFTIGGGFRINPALDVRLGLHILDLGHAGDSMELVVGAGYNFWQG